MIICVWAGFWRDTPAASASGGLSQKHKILRSSSLRSQLGILGKNTHAIKSDYQAVFCFSSCDSEPSVPDLFQDVTKIDAERAAYLNMVQLENSLQDLATANDRDPTTSVGSAF
jgi:hypothetical protein